MSSAAKKLASYGDVLAAPEHLIAQLVDGQLHTQPRQAYRHALAGTLLSGALSGKFHGGGDGGPGGWVILFEPELHLGPHVQVPDIASWRRQRMPSCLRT